MWDTSSITSWVLGHTTFHENSEPPASTSTGALCNLVFECPDDQLAFVPVMALFKTASFFFTLDLDFQGEGEDDGETETLIMSLEIKGVIHLHKNFSTLIHRIPGRLHCYHRQAKDQASSGKRSGPNPSSLCLRPNRTFKSLFTCKGLSG